MIGPVDASDFENNKPRRFRVIDTDRRKFAYVESRAAGKRTTYTRYDSDLMATRVGKDEFDSVRDDAVSQFDYVFLASVVNSAPSVEKEAFPAFRLLINSLLTLREPKETDQRMDAELARFVKEGFGYKLRQTKALQDRVSHYRKLLRELRSFGNPEEDTLLQKIANPVNLRNARKLLDRVEAALDATENPPKDVSVNQTRRKLDMDTIKTEDSPKVYRDHDKGEQSMLEQLINYLVSFFSS